MWNSQFLRALMSSLREHRNIYNYSLPPIRIDGRDLVIECSRPRGILVKVSWGNLEMEGYHQELTDEDFQNKFGFGEQQLSTLMDWVNEQSMKIAQDHGLVEIVEALVIEWNMTLEERYIRDLEIISSELDDDQDKAVEKYCFMYIDYRRHKNNVTFEDVAKAFISLLADSKIPAEVVLQIRLLEDKYTSFY